jgi:chitosanase
MFSDRAKLIALAIVHIFETSKPLGDYTAVAVLNDGAGISYGINQFTHRSGSLYAVIEAYLAQRPTANVEIITRALPYLKLTTFEAIRQCSINAALKNALAAAGHSPEMQLAQRKVMFERYLGPAIDACEGSNFTLPLSLAVIYDSTVHGSYDKIRDRVAISRGEHPNAEDFEKQWIADYVAERDAWLSSVPRLASTRYRTRLFLNLIKNANWNLDLPIIVQGIKLTDATLGLNSTAVPVVQPTSTGDVSVAIPDKPLVTPKIEQPSTNSPQTVVQQQVPLYVKIGAVFTFLTGLGINAGSLIQQKLTELTPPQLLYCVLALGLCYFAVWWLRHERKAATQLTNKLVDAAADPTQNTVEIQK